MGELIRSVDWSGSSVGPIDAWPQSLRTALGICLSSRFPMAIWWGPEIVQFYNDGYRPFLGAKHPRSMGQRGNECWAEIWDVCGPLYRRVMATGESTWSADLQLLMERNGYLEETYFTFSYSPIRGETAEVLGNLITVTETTGRVLGERRLRTLRDLGALAIGGKTPEEAMRLAAATLSANPADVPFALLYLIDEKGRSARLAAASGLAPGAPASPVTLELADGGTWPIGRVVSSGRSMVAGDLGALGPLPREPWTDPAHTALVLPLLSGDAVAGVLVAGVSPRRELDDAYRSFYDVLASQIATALTNARAHEEERKRAEVLAAVDREKTRFFSNVSHEFRTPLTLLLGPLEELLAPRAQALPQEDRESLQTAHRNGLRLLKLVNTLLDFSRIEAGRAHASYAPTDLAKLTAELASNFSSACEKAGLRLRVECPPLHEPVYVDRGMWEKIVLNLLSNAFKFTFEGEIEVALADTGAGVELRVRDTGIGVAAREIPRLFERFHRIEGAKARTHEGSGIGLAFVQELVHMHGGEIRVDSELGRGSTFTVCLRFGSGHLPREHLVAEDAATRGASNAPAYVEEALGWLRGDAAPGLSDGAGASRSAARVLVVDDNADMREYVARLLRERWQVTSAADGREALELLGAQAFDLVISDVMMPGLDGFGLLRAVKSSPATAELPVMLLSARAGEEARVEGLFAGADDYIVKPFTAQQLLAQVSAQLAMRQIRRENAAERERLLAREQAAKLEAQSANRAKDEFLAMLGHELRNPLAPIITAIQLMRLRGVSSPELGMLERQTRHLTRLVDDLLDVSRITRGKIELRKRPLEIVDTVLRAMEMVSPLLEQRAHRVHTQDVPASGLALEADPERLAQVIANLLSNAAKYSDAGSVITLSACRAGERVRFSVKDEGAGIAPDMLESIFNLFVQQPQTLARSEGGLGLGLAIVRSLVELHGGTVTVHSAGLGQGSEFVVELPAARDAAQSASSHQAAVAAAAAHAKRILVVDDNVDAGTMLGALLRLQGHEVELAQDGPEALSKAARFRPEIALIDIGLPMMDGYELARRLKQLCGQERALRIVAVTGYGLESDRERSAQAGFDDHLVKPVDIVLLDRLLSERGSPDPRAG